MLSENCWAVEDHLFFFREAHLRIENNVQELVILAKLISDFYVTKPL